jgi:hypothetical protein
MDIIYLVGTRRGFAARQCGKTLPYRRTILRFLRLRLLQNKGGIASNQWNVVTVRQSLTALCGGKAATPASCWLWSLSGGKTAGGQPALQSGRLRIDSLSVLGHHPIAIKFRHQRLH